MSYYKIIYSDTDYDAVVIHDYDLRGFKYTDILEGKPLKHWDDGILLFCRGEGRFEDYLPNPLHWPVLSNQFVAILDRLGVTQVQLFPAHIRCSTTCREIKGYQIANITELIPALDREKSEFGFWDEELGEVRNLKKTVIDQSRVRSGAHLFRLAEHPVSLFVSQVLKTELQIGRITGVDFWEVETA
jgi:hypothetical protein